MNFRESVHYVLRFHATKILGFAQVTVGVFALNAEDLFGKHGAKIVLVISGLLTAWRGFWVGNVVKEAEREGLDLPPGTIPPKAP